MIDPNLPIMALDYSNWYAQVQNSRLDELDPSFLSNERNEHPTWAILQNVHMPGSQTEQLSELLIPPSLDSCTYEPGQLAILQR